MLPTYANDTPFRRDKCFTQVHFFFCRDPLYRGGLMWSERKHGLSTKQVPVSAYVGSSKNLQDLNGPSTEQVPVSAYVGSSKNLKDLNVSVLYVSVVGAPMLQPFDTMRFTKADLGSVCGRARTYFGSKQEPQENHPLCRTRSGVRPCWELEEPKGPNGSISR
jgi:hypothetical protein